MNNPEYKKILTAIAKALLGFLVALAVCAMLPSCRTTTRSIKAVTADSTFTATDMSRTTRADSFGSAASKDSVISRAHENIKEVYYDSIVTLRFDSLGRVTEQTTAVRHSGRTTERDSSSAAGSRYEEKVVVSNTDSTGAKSSSASASRTSREDTKIQEAPKMTWWQKFKATVGGWALTIFGVIAVAGVGYYAVRKFKKAP